MKASSHYSSHEKRWVDGSEYTWGDFTKVIDTVVEGDKVKVPSTLTSFMILVGDLILYAILAWYLDHVIASNRGSPDSYFFFLHPRYWGCRKRSRKINPSIPPLNTKITDPSLLIPSQVPLIQLENLNKIFQSRKCFKKGQKIHAVQNFSLKITENELLGILGHNGAGKSTLINIITGLCPITSGTGEIFGYDIKEEMSEIRKMLGVCPQHDILWNELTAKEHLVLFGMIKGANRDQAQEDADKILKKLKLDSVSGRQVGTFSGGMKRRLSVGISGVGNPRLIIMDEPTTGMDPINRRCAWKLIQEMKKDRLLLLTTHSMEEADVLSDRVCVIVDGALQCIGTSLYLKNRFGDGFRITLVTGQPQKVVDIVKVVFKACKVLDVSAGSVLIAIPLEQGEEIFRFFREMEGNTSSELMGFVDDWGFSNTTLEEVFMRVTGKKISSLE
jgi:ABC-type multidrug transport system ATPase subunit